MKEKNSNHELMRIISMYLIVLFHVILHGYTVMRCQNPSLKLVLEFINILTLVHVNSFILLTGYYQSTSTFKQKQIWKIVGEVIFYKLTIVIIYALCGFIEIDKVFIAKEFNPLEFVFTEYWFINIYLLLYILSPFINKAINAYDKNTFRNLLIVLTLIFSVAPVITGGKVFDNNGFTLYQFVYLYLIGAYIRRYPIEKSSIGKKLSKQAMQLILVIIMISAVILNFVTYRAAVSLVGINDVLDIYANYIIRSVAFYSNPFVMIQTIAYFCFFGTLKIKSKIINNIGKCTIGIYLIHDNKFIRETIYNWLKIRVPEILSFRFLIRIILVSILIFIASLLIEEIRQFALKYIRKVKFINNIEEKYYLWIENIKRKTVTNEE